MADSTTLSRDDILSADDRDEKRVEVEEWGGHVFLKKLSAAQVEAWLDDNANQTGPHPEDVEITGTHVQAKLLTLCLVDEDGEKLFDYDEADLLSERSAGVINRLGNIAMDLNDINEEVDDLAGN